MQNSTASTAPNETSGLTSTQQSKPQAMLTWTLQRLNRTWFLFDGQVLRIEKKATDGATDEQWRGFMASSGVRIKNAHGKPLGPLARRDMLNMIEHEHPDRMPTCFDSREAAEQALRIEAESKQVPSIADNEMASHLPSGLPSSDATCLADVLQGKGYIAMNAPSKRESNDGVPNEEGQEP